MQKALVPVFTEQERKFIRLVSDGTAETAAAVTCGFSEDYGYKLVRQPAISAAIRGEVMRLLAIDGVVIGRKALRAIANDTTAPAAARVSAGKALLQAGGLLEATAESRHSKSLNEMTRDELRAFIESAEKEIDQAETVISNRATLITAPVSAPEASETLSPFD